MSAAFIAQEKEQLLDDVRQVLASTEELLDAADDGSAQGKELRRKVGEKLKVAKTKLLEAEQAVVGKAKVAAKATDQYVHDNPWKSIGIAAGVGFLLGMLVSRR
ncbi:hypothetical protein CEK28_11830 [Xenophilus sp. AP218F]|nr:hypothetical protein CEK28_11830 [Xenophilus sp. AP218F]